MTHITIFHNQRDQIHKFCRECGKPLRQNEPVDRKQDFDPMTGEPKLRGETILVVCPMWTRAQKLEATTKVKNKHTYTTYFIPLEYDSEGLDDN